MKFYTVALTAVLGLSALVAAIPQATGTGTVAASSAPASTVTQTPAQSSTAACLKACNPGDVYCQAACEGLPTPDGTAVNATHNCVAACPQGSGTAADNAAYASCESSCINSLYYTASSSWASYTGPAPAATYTVTTGGTVATVTGTAASTATGTSGNSTASGTHSSGTSAPSPTGNAASSFGINTPVFGALGLFIVALAL